MGLWAVCRRTRQADLGKGGEVAAWVWLVRGGGWVWVCVGVCGCVWVVGSGWYR